MYYTVLTQYRQFMRDYVRVHTFSTRRKTLACGLYSFRCFDIMPVLQGLLYRPRNAKGKGALCRWEKEILALGPKTSPGQGPKWCFLQQVGGGAEFEVTPLMCLICRGPCTQHYFQPGLFKNGCSFADLFKQQQQQQHHVQAARYRAALC